MPTWVEYQALLAESEYAAWLLAIGLRANHFTISVNHLENYRTLQQVVQAVKEAGFALNTVGGEIKGSSEVFLEQASTLADKQQVEFADGDEHQIATCFYEFALRYPQSDGALFQGFVEGNADKIFDSTNSR
jgi:copper chaperone CopZ